MTRAALSLVWGLCLVVLGSAHAGDEVGARLNPASVRAKARAAGLGSLAWVTRPTPSNLYEFVRDTDDGRTAARQLGKALFWDMQVGSDGQACASCHFHAGADSRVRNQLNPGINAGDTHFGNPGAAVRTETGHPRFAPNYALEPSDFPLHRVDTGGLLDFSRRTVLADTNDVVGSQGAFSSTFTGIVAGKAPDAGEPRSNSVFEVDGRGVRQVGSRQAPSVINAVFNGENFWDGRARSIFNGSSPFGPLDGIAGVFIDDPTNASLVKVPVSIDHASLASQAVEPPLSAVEMSFDGRTFAQLGRKMLSLRPLGLQFVSPQDSVLGPMSRATISDGRVSGAPGLDITYAALIERAFEPRWWASTKQTDGFTQMEANFSLFFGLAIQLYEALLVSDQTPFDRFMDGDNTALTEAQLLGLVAFIKNPFSTGDVFAGVGKGNCTLCHGGPGLSAASTAKFGMVLLSTTIQVVDGKLSETPIVAFNEVGFANTGVRPTSEDVGRGATVLGQPLSITRRAVAGLSSAPLPPCGNGTNRACPAGARDLVQGAFKIPGLRNVELTGPYFHNGGQATLQQVLDYYRRHGDFADVNVADVNPIMSFMDFDVVDGQRMVDFLLSLTDERVRQEQAPFDHPQLFVPNGSPTDSLGPTCAPGIGGCDSGEEIPATGAGGRSALGLPPLGPFLGLDPRRP